MEFELILAWIRASLTIAVLSLFIGSGLWSLESGFALFAGGLWGAANLYMLKQLMENLLLPKEKKLLKIFFIGGIKFPLLYSFGYLLLKMPGLPTLNLLLGFSFNFLGLCFAGATPPISSFSEGE